MNTCRSVLLSVLLATIPIRCALAGTEEVCPFEKPTSQIDPTAIGVVKHYFKSSPNSEAIETLDLRSGDHIEILDRGCEYEELEVKISSATFAPLHSRREIYRAAASAIGNLRKFTKTSPYVYPYVDVATALLRAAKAKTPPQYQTELEVPIVEGMMSMVKVESFSQGNKGGTLTILMNRGPL